MNIVLDIDGVLGDFYGHFAHKIGRQLPMQMDAKITSQEWAAIRASDFWATMPLLEGGRYLARLGPLAQNLWLLTSRPVDARAGTLAWLDASGIRLYNDMHLLMVHPSADKIKHLCALAPCAFLDDYLPVVATVDGYDEIDAQLMLQPWNAAVLQYFAKVRAVASVKEFLDAQ